MPTYEYQCQACGHRFEVFQRMSDPKLEHCPQDGCGGHVRRLPGPGAGVIFKGSGFYQTDYRSESYRKAQRSEGKAADSKPAESKPAESKPADGKPGGSGPACGSAAA